MLADDLDSPAVLPGGGSQLTLTEPGPVGILSSSVQSIQQLQALLRSASPIPGASLVGTVNDDATLTTAQSISDIQAFLASSALPYDIIALTAPPGSYAAGVHSQFQLRNGIRGTTVYNAAGSGALLQGGLDTLSGDSFSKDHGATAPWRPRGHSTLSKTTGPQHLGDHGGTALCWNVQVVFSRWQGDRSFSDGGEMAG